MDDPYPGHRGREAGRGPVQPQTWDLDHPGDDEVWKASRDDDALSSAESQARSRSIGDDERDDPSEHTRVRRSVSRAFTPRPMRSREAAINEVADELVDAMIAREEPSRSTSWPTSAGPTIADDAGNPDTRPRQVLAWPTRSTRARLCR